MIANPFFRCRKIKTEERFFKKKVRNPIGDIGSRGCGRVIIGPLMAFHKLVLKMSSVLFSVSRHRLAANQRAAHEAERDAAVSSALAWVWLAFPLTWFFKWNRETMKLLGLLVTLFSVASADDTKKGPLVTDKVIFHFVSFFSRGNSKTWYFLKREIEH